MISPQANFKAGVVLINQQKYRQAIKQFNQVLKKLPLHGPSHYNLGVAYAELGEIPKAIHHYLQATRIHPDYAKAFFELGVIHFTQNQSAKAQAYFQTALKHDPNLPDAYVYLGLIADFKHKLSDAKNYFEQGLALAPKHSALLAHRLAFAHREHDYSTIRQLKSNQPDNTSPSPFTSLIISNDPLKNLEIARWWSTNINNQTSYSPIHKSKFLIHNSKLIRVGYLSADFRDHVVGRLIKNLFLNHSTTYYPHLYCLNPPDNSLLYRHFAHQPHFINVHSDSPRQIAHQIRTDKIDILIDLACFTKGGHPEICALRPAPIQINYLGFPGSSGADFYDYLIGDSVLIPPDHERFHTEKILRLPHYLVTSYSAPRSPELSRTDEVGPHPFTFACLTHPIKYTDHDLVMWFNILNQVPHSQLLLQDENPTATANILNFAANHHLNPRRLVFLPHQSYPQFLTQIAKVDLALDSPHYNGGGTTADLLYAGVPVVTLAGHRYVERMGAAILTAAGLPKLITHSKKEYIDLAVNLATHPNKLKKLQSYLLNLSAVASAKEDHKSNLFNTKAWVQNLERGLETIWSRYQQGLPPDHITIS